MEFSAFNQRWPSQQEVRLIINLTADWTAIQQKRRDPGEVRQELLSGHAITLVALGCLGNYLLRQRPKDWQQELQAIDLAGVDWSKTNPDWQEMIFLGGCIRKNKATAIAMFKYLENRTKLSQEYLENLFSTWLKIRHHQDTIAQLVQDPQWEAETKLEAMATIAGRYDTSVADTA